jgi:class 3 adenylate cyclase
MRVDELPRPERSIVWQNGRRCQRRRRRVASGFEGTEQLITVLFVDLRRSSLLARAKMPYDFLYILNQFFYEMTKALAATNGHYAHFAGDGLMALYGSTARTRRPAPPTFCAEPAKCWRAWISSTAD